MSGFRRARAPAPADLAHHEYYIFMLPVYRGPSTADLVFFSPIISTRGLFYSCYIDVNLRLRSPPIPTALLESTFLFYLKQFETLKVSFHFS